MTITKHNVSMSDVLHKLLALLPTVAPDIPDSETTEPAEGETLTRIVLCREAYIEPGAEKRAKGDNEVAIRLIWKGDALTFETNKANRQRAPKPRDIKVTLHGSEAAWSVSPSLKLFDAIRIHRAERASADAIRAQRLKALETAQEVLNIPTDYKVSVALESTDEPYLYASREGVSLCYRMSNGEYTLKGFDISTPNLADPFPVIESILGLIQAAPVVVVQAEQEEEAQEEAQESNEEPQESNEESEAQEEPEKPQKAKRKRGKSTRQGKATAKATGKARKGRQKAKASS